MVESTTMDILEGDPNEFVLGHPRRAYFNYTKMKALVIVVSDYSTLREEEGKERYLDLPSTITDAAKIEKGLKHLGFAEEDIVVLKEPKWNQVHTAILTLATELSKANADGERTLLFAYYAGHGMADQHLQVQLNETKRYPMEKMLRSIAKMDGSYVMGLFDCCRERIVAEPSRGGGEADDDGMAAAGNSLPEQQENFIITYGCPPTEGVPAKSTIAKAYIKFLKQ